jgi:hypothetical protein
VATLRLRLAPSAAGLLKLQIVRLGLHRDPKIRALVDQLDGDLLVILRSSGQVDAALTARDPAALRAALPGPLDLGDAVPAEWRHPLHASVGDRYAVLTTADQAPAATPAGDTPPLLLDLRPAALPAPVLDALLRDARPWAPLVRRLQRFTLSVWTGDVLRVEAELSGY